MNKIYLYAGILILVILFYKTIMEILNALYRDVKGGLLLLTTKTKFKLFEAHQSTIWAEFQKVVRRSPDKPCIVYNDRVWTFRDLETYCNQVACLFSKKYNLKKGDCVALFMENKPEYIGIWLGLSQIGVITALINTNLKNESLIHCIDVSNADYVIFDAPLEQSINDVKDKLKKDVHLLIQGDKAKLTNAMLLEDLLSEKTVKIVDTEVHPNDTMLYIYTSGTTGLPKPAIIKQSRYYVGAFTFFNAAGLSPRDSVYLTLPLYHSNGAILGTGAAIICGATVVLRKKFSASNFWRECIQYNCTAFIYVGEICRFLLNQPASAFDKQHRVRKAFGNGMRENVWREFTNRFNVQCYEFYAASEGNCTMVNSNCRIGACGFSPLINHVIPIYPIYLIRIDDEMNPIRDSRGFCIKCRAGEKGLLIGMISKSPVHAFNGYANNTQASSKKIIDNVFKTGQSAFNSGDLMMMDKYGYVYFCDRLGDTFRWKGENVSTIEVENIISKHLNSKEVVVYGVEIPGQEGRAGMAAIHVDPESIDLKSLAQKLKVDLPAYAKPLFVRFAQELEHTGTFKATKLKLVKDAFNVNAVQDPIYYFDSKEDTYKKLTTEVYENILKGIIRF